MVADVAAVADPATGLAVYDSYGSSTGKNWYVIGGTSAASPLIAGIYAQARASNGRGLSYGELPYGHTSSLFDITTGKNGSCSTSLKALCTAGAGYDGPTGLGTPNGLGAF
jgi:subtilase family serine protease